MNTHTPAPWKVLIDEDEKYPLSVIDPTTENHPQGPVHICNINPNLGTESEANAALIAAAPELLQALTALADAARHMEIIRSNPEYEMMEADWQRLAINTEQANRIIKQAQG